MEPAHLASNLGHVYAEAEDAGKKAAAEIAAVATASFQGFTVDDVVSFLALVAGWVANVFFLIGPVLMFVPQYKSIRDSGSATGFSTNVCLVLLVSHTMRCFFWIGKRFELVLLFQSVIVVVSQLVLLQICVRCNFNERHRQKGSTSSTTGIEMTSVAVSTPRSPRDSSAVSEVEQRVQGVLDDFRHNKFWAWDAFATYLSFLFCYVLMLVGLTVMFLDNETYFETIGFIGLCIEATLTIPQGLRNHRRRSTDGLSLFLVFNWIFGDTTRFIIFVLRQSPVRASRVIVSTLSSRLWVWFCCCPKGHLPGALVGLCLQY